MPLPSNADGVTHYYYDFTFRHHQRTNARVEVRTQVHDEYEASKTKALDDLDAISYGHKEEYFLEHVEMSCEFTPVEQVKSVHVHRTAEVAAPGVQA